MQNEKDMASRKLQKQEVATANSDKYLIKAKQLEGKIADMRRQHMLELDQEKEKYAALLTKNAQTEQAFEALALKYEGKEQECMTLQSYNQIQTNQINTLQAEIASMLEKLESIKSNYEGELTQKAEHLTSTQNLALQQLKNMQQTMRQDAVNNQKEIMRLREELRVKAAQKRRENSTGRPTTGDRQDLSLGQTLGSRLSKRPQSAMWEGAPEKKSVTKGLNSRRSKQLSGRRSPAASTYSR